MNTINTTNTMNTIKYYQNPQKQAYLKTSLTMPTHNLENHSIFQKPKHQKQCKILGFLKKDI